MKSARERANERSRNVPDSCLVARNDLLNKLSGDGVVHLTPLAFYSCISLVPDDADLVLYELGVESAIDEFVHWLGCNDILVLGRRDDIVIIMRTANARKFPSVVTDRIRNLMDVFLPEEICPWLKQ